MDSHFRGNDVLTLTECHYSVHGVHGVHEHFKVIFLAEIDRQ